MSSPPNSPTRQPSSVAPPRSHRWTRTSEACPRTGPSSSPPPGAELAPALCYFGCAAPDADFLHAGELRAAEAAGAVSLRPAFSTAGTFVQHRVAAEADEVWALLGAGARVYVCGDGSRMAPGVRDAFRTLYRDRAPDADGPAADAWLDGLIADGRYIEDVYAAG